MQITSVTIPRRVQILCPECFSYCKSLSSISFEIDSELTHIEPILVAVGGDPVVGAPCSDIAQDYDSRPEHGVWYPRSHE
jgi:hypothetical protein